MVLFLYWFLLELILTLNVWSWLRMVSLYNPDQYTKFTECFGCTREYIWPFAYIILINAQVICYYYFYFKDKKADSKRLNTLAQNCIISKWWVWIWIEIFSDFMDILFVLGYAIFISQEHLDLLHILGQWISGNNHWEIIWAEIQ